MRHGCFGTTPWRSKSERRGRESSRCRRLQRQHLACICRRMRHQRRRRLLARSGMPSTSICIWKSELLAGAASCPLSAATGRRVTPWRVQEGPQAAHSSGPGLEAAQPGRHRYTRRAVRAGGRPFHDSLPAGRCAVRRVQRVESLWQRGVRDVDGDARLAAALPGNAARHRTAPV